MVARWPAARAIVTLGIVTLRMEALGMATVYMLLVPLAVQRAWVARLRAGVDAS